MKAPTASCTVLFVDGMTHTSTSESPKKLKEFFKLYDKDLNYTGGDLTKSFLGIDVDQ
jgi:hypothetical protein